MIIRAFLLSIFLISTNVSASVTFTASGGIDSLKTKELADNSGSASGIYSGFSLGLMNGKTEIGVYSSNLSSQTEITHDSEANDLDISIASIGAYLTYYKDSLYFGIGYGKATIKETLTSNLTGSSLEALKDIYKISSDGETSSTEARALIGFRILSFSSIAFSIYGQKIKMLESSHDDTNFGLELKINI